MRLFHDNFYWTTIADGNKQAMALFKKHYTFKERKQKKNAGRFAGPGERIVLLSTDGKALFVWRKELYRKDDQTGVNCAVFRNEGKILSSELILQAEEIAWQRWPGARLFTFINARKIKSTNPGYCYKKAGWKVCGESKARKLVILEKIKTITLAQDEN